MIEIVSSGSFNRTENFLKRILRGDLFSVLSQYGQAGVNALANATPVDSGLTAASWTFEVIRTKTSWEIVWRNTNVVAGRPVAILLQYGHGTGTGGYVTGRDYINPAILPIFDKIASDVWKVVTSA